MPFVQRDQGGTITETTNVPQPGRAEEFLTDDDPEVIAFLAPPPPPDPVDTQLTPDDIERLLIGLGVTQAQIDAAKRARP